MRLLLDTHAFLWWVSDDPALPNRVRRQLSAPRNEVFVSAVSVWEIVVKAALGKLTIPLPAERFVPEQLVANGFEALPLSITHALAVDRLPAHHRDPYDRLLVAQAVTEGMTIASGDQQIAAYPVKIVW